MVTPHLRIAAAAAALALLIAPLGTARVSAAPAAAVAPVSWDLTPAQIATSCAAAIARYRSRVDAVTHESGPQTFATVVLPLEQAGADLNDTLEAQGFLTNVSTDAKVRDASLKCNDDQGNLFAELGARPDIYRAYAAASKSKTAHTEAQKKLLDLALTALQRSGAGLPPAKRARFVALEKRLTEDQNQYNKNLGDDATTITITAEQAKSLPPDFVAANLKANADGGYTVPDNESTVGTFLRNETDGDARKAYYIAYNNRGGAANVKLLEDAIAIRAELATIMGYKTWAAYQLADKMAGTPARVQSFLAGIDRAVIGKARSERDEDTALKDATFPGAPLEAWDQNFYENLLKRTKYSVDQNEVKQYFPVQHVVDSVLGIYQELLGLKFTRDTAARVWDPSVLAYDVNDSKTHAPLGRFYLDLFPRPGKYDHFANFPLSPRRVMPDGSIRLTTSAIVGNWPAPAPGKVALLTHGDVETFFHEFGHNMAAILADTPYQTLNSGFRSDFVEAPSQMLENWAWNPGILKRVSSNVTTGLPLPDDLIAKMVAARYVHYALTTTSQILYSTVDMSYHTMTPPVDTTAVWAATVAATTPNAFVDGTHPQAGFGHLMGGYDAGYYGYLWSKVYAQDMFSRFASQGLTSPIAGAAYRKDILAPARMEEPDQEVRTFLGRPMSPNAFYKELGIAPPS
jgi:thimet oligopeptidase